MDFIYGVKEVLGLGLEPKDLSFLQISLRGLIVFIVTIVMVRMGDKRFLARMTAFDAILGFILASMLARAINGSAPFFPTLGAGFVLVLFHRLMGFIAQRSHKFGKLIKGQEDVLIDHGRIIPKAMHRNHLSEEDLLEELRLQGKVSDPNEVKRAIIERNGQISVVKK